MLLWSTKLRESLRMGIENMLDNITGACVSRVSVQTWHTVCVPVRVIPDRCECPKPTYHINIRGRSSSVLQVKDESAPGLTWMWKH